MTFGEKNIFYMFLFCFLVFIGMSLEIYTLKLDNKKIVESQHKVIEAFEKDTKFLTEQSVFWYEYVQEDMNFNKIFEQKISILEESIDAKNIRWAKIKQIRGIIEDSSENNLNIKEYTIMAGAIFDYSEEYDVPISLVMAVMKRESNFNPKALSSAGARGLMQIMLPTAQDISPEIGRRHYNLYSIKNNIQFGTWYLWKMLDRFDGDVELAIRGYNCGPTCVEKVTSGIWLKYPEETIYYHEAVMRYKKEFEEMGL